MAIGTGRSRWSWTIALAFSKGIGSSTQPGRWGRKPELVAENAFLRQQLVGRGRTVTRPACTRLHRVLLVLLASRLRGWKHPLVIACQ